MSQTNTNTGGSNTNRNLYAGGGIQGQGGSGSRGCSGRGNGTIDKSLFEGKVKNSYLHKLTSTECSHRTTQFKKIHDALPVLCADKGFRFINNVILTNTELIKTNHLPTYPDTTLWWTVANIKIDLVDKNAALDAQNGTRPIIKVEVTVGV